MGPKIVPAPTTQIEGATTTTAADSTALAEVASVLEEIVGKENDLPPAIVEEQKRQADLERLNTMAAETRREIASMDMMGEFGSKVSFLPFEENWEIAKDQINFLIKHLLWYRIKDKSARHVVFSNWSDSLFSKSFNETQLITSRHPSIEKERNIVRLVR